MATETVPVKTSRASGAADVLIDYATCNGCGLCVKVCKGAPLYMQEGLPQVDQSRLFGCIACGHCAAICPSGSIVISGRDMSAEDLLKLPAIEQRAAYAPLYNLMLARRSAREFLPREVEPQLVEQILAAASTAPMGVPPSDVGVLVFAGREKVDRLRTELTAVLRTWQKWLTPFTLAMMRPFVSAASFEMFQGFIVPAVQAYIEKADEGVDWFFYQAPLAMYFYGSAYSDPADPVIAATQAMLAGESLGLGTCMLGFPGYIFKYDSAARARYRLPRGMQPGIMLIFGYPRLRFHRAIRRRFARLDYA